jgi:hypothetical protein
MNVQEGLELLKGHGRVTVTSDHYNRRINKREDHWCVTVALGSGKTVTCTHGDLHWAVNNALLEIETIA